ncbi:MAG: hypothetical protein GF344_12175, partial [Chitinivibrionales bacterium]|nr:hypothetical protein [Chitinivibrionales bacterium]
PIDDNTFRGSLKKNIKNLSESLDDANVLKKIESWIKNQSYSKLLEPWVSGLDFDWSMLYEDTPPNRISLPPYPFARERYWIQKDEEKTVKTASVMHPLLHSNISDFDNYTYTSKFNGSEAFIRDLRFQGRHGTSYSIIPTSAILEIIYAALKKVTPQLSKESEYEINDIVFGEPVIVTEQITLNIDLMPTNRSEINYEIYGKDSKEEKIYCQGNASVVSKSPINRHNLERLKAQCDKQIIMPDDIYSLLNKAGIVCGLNYRTITKVMQGDRKVMAYLNLTNAAKIFEQEFFLHPAIIEGAMHASLFLSLTGNEMVMMQSMPSKIVHMRIASTCKEEMIAVIYPEKENSNDEAGDHINIDICNSSGDACIQIQGILREYISNSYNDSEEASRSLQSVTSPKKMPLINKENGAYPNLITYSAQRNQKNDCSHNQALHAHILLADLEKYYNQTWSAGPANKPIFALKNKNLQLEEKETTLGMSSKVKIYCYREGIYQISVEDNSNGNRLSLEIIKDLLIAFKNLKGIQALKAVVVGGGDSTFLYGGRKEINEAISNGLFKELIEFPYPIIAAMAGDASGAGFMFAALCDLMICSINGCYSFCNPGNGEFPTETEESILRLRFGDSCMEDFLFQSFSATGEELKSKGWTCAIHPGEKVNEQAHALAANLVEKPANALCVLKRNVSPDIRQLVRELTVEENCKPEYGLREKSATPALTAYNAEIISIDRDSQHALCITMRPKKFKDNQEALIGELEKAFRQAEESEWGLPIIISSEHEEFLPFTIESVSFKLVVRYCYLLQQTTIPVIAVLKNGVKGVAFLISQFCDACVYQSTGIYSANEIRKTSVMAQMAAIMLRIRLGMNLGNEMILTGKEYTGEDIRRKSGTAAVAEPAKMHSRAIEIAEKWGALPTKKLREWKGGNTKRIWEKIGDLINNEEKYYGDIIVSDKNERNITEIETDVLSAKLQASGVLVITMKDRSAKNMFSDALIDGMYNVFSYAERSVECKVIVLKGYDNIFSAGGTKDTLLAIQEGRLKFTDTKIYQLPLTCPVPVIAAMQGHSIGAGWAMGMFADIALFSAESIYSSPYMNYGFTPGAGATLIMPEKMGRDLALESLFTGKNYYGREIRERASRIIVVPRKDIIQTAVSFASDIAQCSREALVSLKTCINQEIMNRLDDSYDRELSMHEKTFVGRKDTVGRIKKAFDGAGEEDVEYKKNVGYENKQEAKASAKVRDSQSIVEIIATLKKMLADELQLGVDEIDEEEKFVDLGLDSITGVTWIRKINEKYKKAIEATKI